VDDDDDGDDDDDEKAHDSMNDISIYQLYLFKKALKLSRLLKCSQLAGRLFRRPITL